MTISGLAKRLLHRDICADPVVHGLVLNLYLNGEQYPHRVGDYFPLAAAEDPWLDATLRAHMRDEDKHIALYAKALQRIGQPVRRLPLEDVYNHVIRSHTRGSFALCAADDAIARRTKLAGFLAHLHFLEARIARSLEFHLEGCARSASDYPAKAVALILADELRHATYTREVVMELLPRGRALDLLATHARAEARANVEFSARQLARLVGEQAARFPVRRRWIYRGCVHVLQQVMTHA